MSHTGAFGLERPPDVSTHSWWKHLHMMDPLKQVLESLLLPLPDIRPAATGKNQSQGRRRNVNVDEIETG